MVTPNQRRFVRVLVFALVLALRLPGRQQVACAEEHLAVQFVPAKPAKPDEPLAPAFSLKLAAQSLDCTARQWQLEYKFRGDSCCQCHANFMYLIARPALAEILPPPTDVRDLFEHLVGDRWEKQGLRYPSEAMVPSLRCRSKS